MISSLTRRSTIALGSQRKTVLGRGQARFASIVPSSSPFPEKRKIHGTPNARQADAAINAPVTAAVDTPSSSSSSLADRFVVTAEVTVSKIFPAGFGWQSASILAENTFGFAPDTMAFALTTGAGDAIGVFMGHCAYYGAKKSLVDSSINMDKEAQTGFLLGTAAFCSGTAWQPLVDMLQGANLSFLQVFAGTWIGCGAAFYVGLRSGRTILSGFMPHIEAPTYENSMNDKSLSAVIGGATGFFVGTDAAYLPDQNFLINVVGITDGTPDLAGCAIAGSSTALGFATSQSVFNLAYPAGKCWND